jgi:hypothetical protein
MAAEKAVLTRRKATARARVTNGKEILPGIDGRSPTARRYRDVLAAVVADMGGEDHCSEARLSLIRRFSAACCMAEQLEARLVNGEAIDIAEHSLLSSTLVRLAQRIGINRVPKNVVPHLTEYLEAASEVAAE